MEGKVQKNLGEEKTEMVLTDDTHTQRRCPGYHGTFYATPSFRVTAAATGEHGRTAVYPSVGTAQTDRDRSSIVGHGSRLLGRRRAHPATTPTTVRAGRTYTSPPALRPLHPGNRTHASLSRARVRVWCYLGMLCRPLLNDLPFPPPPLLVSWSLEVLRRSTLRSGDSFFPLMFAGERRPSRIAVKCAFWEML